MQNNLLLTLRNLVYRTLSFFDKIFFRKTDIVILCYHAIDERTRFSTSFTDFTKQIYKLEKTHFAISLSELVLKIKANKLEKDKKYFVVTFDDGYKSVLKVRKFLEIKGIKPTMSLIQDHKNVVNHESEKFLNQNDILHLIKSGWEFASHTKTHKKLSELNTKDLKVEIARPSSRIKTITYPLGRYSTRVLKEIKREGYQIGLTMDDDFINKSTNLLTLPRVGVDATHDLSIFESIYSPSVIAFRKLIKNSFMKNIFINI